MSISFKLLALSLICGISHLMISCDDGDDEAKVKPPVIKGFTPTSGVPGTTVVISGENFGPNPSDNIVAFNEITAIISSASATELTVTVPPTATSGKIRVFTNRLNAFSSADFTVLETTISGFAPTSGIVGTTVTITGSNFSPIPSENDVKFNDISATVSAATATQLTVTVPAEATTGKITVTLGGYIVTSVSDFVVPSPTITTYSPAIAASNISVIIKGTNFSPTPTNNIVKFNGTAATVTAASETELAVTVPAGATTGPLTVEVGPHTATSAASFEICTGSAELIISDVVVSNNSGATSYFVSFKITNVGSANADLTKMGMQNYASTDAVKGAGDVAASGFSLTSAPTLAPGESYTTPNYSCNIVGGNTSSYPYLIITLNDAPDGSIPECNVENNVVAKAFNP